MTEPAAPPRRSGARWKLALRVTVSAAFLVVLIFKTRDVEDVIPHQHLGLTLTLLAAAAFTALVGVVLSAWRWQRVLMLFDAPAPLRTLTSHYLAGMFVGNVLPSTIGGDVLRVSRASNTVNDSSTAFASVVLERLTGFVALPLLVFAGFAVDPSLLDHAHAWLGIVVAAVTIVVLLALLLVAGHPRIAGRYAENENWTRFIGAIHRGIDRLRRNPRLLPPVLGTAMAYQISVVMVFAFIFRALDLPVPVAAVFAFAPAVLMLQVLPISLGGLGVREGFLVLFLHSFLKGTDIPDSRLVAAGLLWFGCMAIVSMLGAPAFAVGQRQRNKQSVTDRV